MTQEHSNLSGLEEGRSEAEKGELAGNGRVYDYSYFIKRVRHVSNLWSREWPVGAGRLCTRLKLRIHMYTYMYTIGTCTNLR